jgi:type I restriction enzyme R subunit
VRDALPNASFGGFTGTPIEKTDAFDGSTVPIYYESRLAKLAMRQWRK